MSGPLLHVKAVVTCPHLSGHVKMVSSNVRVHVNGMPVVTMKDALVVEGCASQPKKCVLAKFLPSARVRVNSLPVLIYLPGTGVCQSADQSKNGPHIVNMIQTRVMGT